MIVASEPVIPNRQALAQYFTLSGFTMGAEIGVGDGVYAHQLLVANSRLRLLLVDPWDAAGGNRRGELSFIATLRLLSPFDERVTILRETSEEAHQHLPDGLLDFVFIDGCHEYESVRDDVIWWTPKVREGGIVSGHDYYTIKNKPIKSGVERAVNEYVEAHGLTLQTTSWDRGNPERDSRQPCWWFRR